MEITYNSNCYFFRRRSSRDCSVFCSDTRASARITNRTRAGRSVGGNFGWHFGSLSLFSWDESFPSSHISLCAPTFGIGGRDNSQSAARNYRCRRLNDGDSATAVHLLALRFNCQDLQLKTYVSVVEISTVSLVVVLMTLVFVTDIVTVGGVKVVRKYDAQSALPERSGTALAMTATKIKLQFNCATRRHHTSKAVVLAAYCCCSYYHPRQGCYKQKNVIKKHFPEEAGLLRRALKKMN